MMLQNEHSEYEIQTVAIVLEPVVSRTLEDRNKADFDLKLYTEVIAMFALSAVKGLNEN